MNAVAIAYKKTHCLQTRNRPKTCSNRSWLESSPFELMQKISFSMILRILSWCSTLFLYAYTNTFSISHLQHFFWNLFFRCFIWGNATLSQHLSWNGIIYRVLKTLIKGSPCHQKRGLFWDFVVFSTSFVFSVKSGCPWALGTWQLHIGIWSWHLAPVIGTSKFITEPWHFMIGNRNPDYPNPCFCSEFDMVLHDFLRILCEIPCPWPLAICPWPLAICNRNW